MASLGERIRSRRWDELRYRQDDTARAAGLSPSRLSELERDRHRVAEPALRRLALVLGLDPDDLVAHARREGRLARTPPARGDRSADPAGPPPAPVPPRPVPAVGAAWLTTAEAAAALGVTPNAVRHLIGRGALGPAERRRIGKGPMRWVVDAEAVRAFEPGNPGRRPTGPLPVPAGYLSLDGFRAATGLSHGALHRRLESGEVASIRIGRRRLIPERELRRYAEESRD